MGYTLKEMCQKSVRLRTQQGNDLAMYGKEWKKTLGYASREAEIALLDLYIEILKYFHKERSN